MVSSKFLQDDGSDDEVFMYEWAVSGGISVKDLVALEREFLHAMVNHIQYLVSVNADRCFRIGRCS